jgi:hypothetical protein
LDSRDADLSSRLSKKPTASSTRNAQRKAKRVVMAPGSSMYAKTACKTGIAKAM